MNTERGYVNEHLLYVWRNGSAFFVILYKNAWDFISALPILLCISISYVMYYWEESIVNDENFGKRGS